MAAQQQSSLFIQLICLDAAVALGPKTCFFMFLSLKYVRRSIVNPIETKFNKGGLAYLLRDVHLAEMESNELHLLALL